MTEGNWFFLEAMETRAIVGRDPKGPDNHSASSYYSPTKSTCLTYVVRPPYLTFNRSM